MRNLGEDDNIRPASRARPARVRAQDLVSEVVEGRIQGPLCDLKHILASLLDARLTND